MYLDQDYSPALYDLYIKNCKLGRMSQGLIYKTVSEATFTYNHLGNNIKYGCTHQ